MERKTIIMSAVVALVVALVVVVLGLVFFGQSPTVPVDEQSIIERIIERIRSFGATPGPDSFAERACQNGKCTYYYRLPFQTGTTTIGQLLLPQASTTIGRFSAFFTDAGTTTGAQVALYEVGSDWATSSRRAIFGTSNITTSNGRLIGTSTASTTSGTISASTTDLSQGLILQGSTGGSGNRYLLLDYRYGSVPFLGSGFWTLELNEF